MSGDDAHRASFKLHQLHLAGRPSRERQRLTTQTAQAE